MKIKPLGDKILVQRLEAESKTSSGIFLPEGAKEKPQQAKVIAVGEGKVLDNGDRAPISVKKGDIIVMTTDDWGKHEIKQGNEDYIFIKADDVLAIVE